MSFVLDALKLSEKRRSRFARPVYAHPPPVHPRGKRRRWFAVLAAAPILAGVFLAWRLVAPPSPASLPAAVDAPQDSRNLDRTSPGDALPDSPGEERPSPDDPIPVAAAEPAPAAQLTGAAEALPLEMVPPDWPALTLQMLFYSPEKGRGFVQINGRNYRAGERLDDGPEVLEIAPHGVILGHQGKRVLLAMDR